ncbi:hypothetical protein D779_0488 [Imhoffiella purpurea]|uniref:Uncharacterized protein n=1 Tax=Imhoffiella purpurea TaxID=1249627 RepID=W9V996_9GAMM|nr:hypothetical protein D779_0488 [Imhoffiella purpurea]
MGGVLGHGHDKVTEAASLKLRRVAEHGQDLGRHSRLEAGRSSRFSWHPRFLCHMVFGLACLSGMM